MSKAGLERQNLRRASIVGALTIVLEALGVRFREHIGISH